MQKAKEIINTLCSTPQKAQTEETHYSLAGYNSRRLPEYYLGLFLIDCEMSELCRLHTKYISNYWLLLLATLNVLVLSKESKSTILKTVIRRSGRIERHKHGQQQPAGTPIPMHMTSDGQPYESNR